MSEGRGPYRLPSGGRVDRSHPVRFTFDGRPLTGFAGDSLASALLGAGAPPTWRGLVTGRPRGIFSAGAEEPNALVQVRWPGRRNSEPLMRATQVELVDGIDARSLPGRGVLESEDERRFDKRFVHCDVLVVGGGPAGLAAAAAAGESDARVILVDAEPELGGSLLASIASIDGAAAASWVEHVAGELHAMPEVQVLTRSVALGYYDQGYVTVAERRLPGGPTDGILWHVRAKHVVLATGAIERTIVFAGNDRPGVMLASSAGAYAIRYGVAVGRRAAVFTVTEGGFATARVLEDLGIEIAEVVDARKGRLVTATNGDDRLEAIQVDGRWVDCDALLVSGGWNPTLHLFSQSGGALRYDESIAAFVPGDPRQSTYVAGACAGTFELDACVREGFAAGAAAARAAGFAARSSAAPRGTDASRGSGTTAVGVAGADPATAAAPVWLVEPGEGDDGSTHFVDLERDASLVDVRRAIGAGLRSIEHIKRYTTIGTASEQGRLSGVLTSAVAASLLAQDVGAVGVPTFRPPYQAVSFAFLAGREWGDRYDPVRTTPMHAWHVAHGAVFENVGQWKRARFYPKGDESMEAAVQRECRTARQAVALMDVSTLGKIDVQGPDAGVLLDRVYTNAFAKLPIGSCRYGLMCGLDGMVMDDGVTSRLAEGRYHMTTTTGNAALVMDHLQEWLQTEWPDLRVRCTSVTDQWAVAALVGPRARAVLDRLAPGLDVSVDAFPFMTWRDAEIAGLPARVFRISFSGELAYEINVDARHGMAMWEAVISAGGPDGIAPYGTEAMHVLRAEKGYAIVGQETDGSVTPGDLGMDWIVSRSKDFIGRRSMHRSAMARPDRKQLVGLLPDDREALLLEGAQLVEDPRAAPPVPMVGHVTSSYHSAALDRTFALGLLRGGLARIGETVQVQHEDGFTPCAVVSSVLYDPQNLRRDG